MLRKNGLRNSQDTSPRTVVENCRKKYIHLHVDTPTWFRLWWKLRRASISPRIGSWFLKPPQDSKSKDSFLFTWKKKQTWVFIFLLSTIRKNIECYPKTLHWKPVMICTRIRKVSLQFHFTTQILFDKLIICLFFVTKCDIFNTNTMNQKNIKLIRFQLKS